MNINHQLIFLAVPLSAAIIIVAVALSFFAEWMRLRIRRNRRRGSGVVDVIFYDPLLLLDGRVRK